MKKLKLRMDTLRVESFTPEADEAAEPRDTPKELSGLSVYRPCFATEAPSCRC
jgi:hypothetical protein